MLQKLNSEHNGLIERFKELDDRCNELLSEIEEMKKQKEVYEQELHEMAETIEKYQTELKAAKACLFIVYCNHFHMFILTFQVLLITCISRVLLGKHKYHR